MKHQYRQRNKTRKTVPENLQATRERHSMTNN